MPAQIEILTDEEWPGGGFAFELPIRPESTALVVIDVQGYALDANGHLAGTVRRHNPHLQEQYLARVETMIGNIQRLLNVFRRDRRRVIYTRHGAQLRDGSDLIIRRRDREAASLTATGERSGHLAVKGDSGYEIDSRVAPRDDELVLDKNTSSAFHTTAIDLYLRNMEIDTVVVTGVAADQCVLATAIDAADRGLHVIIAADAVANLDPGSALATQVLFGRVWGYVMQTADIIDWLTTGTRPAATGRCIRS